MISRRDAVRKVRLLMAENFPRVRKFTVVAKPVRLTNYGYVAAVWDGGKCVVELPEPYQVSRRWRAMKLSVRIEDRLSSETHPVEGGMLCDGMNTVNPRLLSRIADAVLRMRASGECEVITISLHPYGCPHEVIP